MNASEGKSRDQEFVRERYKFEDGAPRALCTGNFDEKEGTDLAVALWGSNSVAFLMNK